MTATSDLCSDDDLNAVLEAVSGGDADLRPWLERHPGDPRLQFLHGSVLAGDRDYTGARAAMARALEISPGFEIARFQLGFLEFTSGEPARAAETWAPFSGLPEAHPLRLFSEGLMRLAVDDVPGAVSRLRRGIELNDANPPLNKDMQLLISELSQAGEAGIEPTSETDLLMRQFDRDRR